MTRKEALKLAIDGFKVRHKEWPKNVSLEFETATYGFPFKVNNRKVWQLSEEVPMPDDDWEVYEEPKFDAHAYLLQRGWKEDVNNPCVYYPTGFINNSGLHIALGPYSCCVMGNKMGMIWNMSRELKRDKQSVDKAIKLIKFLEELE